MNSRGFTLIELLVALFITAIVFAMGYGAISQALTARESLTAHQDRLNEVETAVRVMTQDFAQLAARPVRDSLGTGLLPALLSQAGQSAAVATDSAPGTSPADTTDTAGVDMVLFTRAGWANPAGIQRPELERVSYRLVGGTLRRLHWLVLDGTETSLPVRRDLLGHVRAVTFRFMDPVTRQWFTQWPAPGNGSLRSRPMAIEITLDLDDWGHIVRVVEVPA